MRISDWISDVCSSDLFSISTSPPAIRLAQGWGRRAWSTASWCRATRRTERRGGFMTAGSATQRIEPQPWMTAPETRAVIAALTAAGAEVRFVGGCVRDALARSEEHTSELQSLMRISYAVFCLKNKKYTQPSR